MRTEHHRYLLDTNVLEKSNAQTTIQRVIKKEWELTLPAVKTESVVAICQGGSSISKQNLNENIRKNKI